jgi:spermidine synthase
VEQKQVRSYRGTMFVFTELCFVTSHRHSTGVPAVHTVFSHVSRYLTTASIAEITEVTAVFTLSIQNQSTHTSLTPSVKKKKRELREKLLFYETQRSITSLQSPANEPYPEHIPYSDTQFLHIFPTTCPILSETSRHAGHH